MISLIMDGLTFQYNGDEGDIQGVMVGNMKPGDTDTEAIMV